MLDALFDGFSRLRRSASMLIGFFFFFFSIFTLQQHQACPTGHLWANRFLFCFFFGEDPPDGVFFFIVYPHLNRNWWVTLSQHAETISGLSDARDGTAIWLWISYRGENVLHDG